MNDGPLGGSGTISGATTVQTGASLTAGIEGATGTINFTSGLTTDSGSTWLIDLVRDVNGSSDLVSLSVAALNLNSATLRLLGLASSGFFFRRIRRRRNEAAMVESVKPGE